MKLIYYSIVLIASLAICAAGVITPMLNIPLLAKIYCSSVCVLGGITYIVISTLHIIKEIFYSK